MLARMIFKKLWIMALIFKGLSIIFFVILKIFNFGNSKSLDVGCGNGIITRNLGKICKEIIGVDIEDKRLIKEGYKFILIKDEKLPFKDNTFDVVISNQVIEHVNDQDDHIKEIYRVLKDDGVCYL